MNIKNFNRMLWSLAEEEGRILRAKGQDYTRGDDDRLANFKRIARDIGCSPLLVWYVYFAKHIDAIASFVKTGKVESEELRGRFIDARNYLALGYALYMDEQELKPATETLKEIEQSDFPNFFETSKFIQPAQMSIEDMKDRSI